MKKTLSLVVCIFLIVSILAGCGGVGDNSTATATTSAINSTAEAAPSTEAKPEPITFTMFNSSAAPQYDNYESPVAKKMQEITGVTLKMEHAVGDPKEKIALLAASGEYPDLVYAQEYINTLVDAGALVKLDEMIEKSGENIKKFYGPYLQRHKWSLEDPSIYYVGTSPLETALTEAPIGFGLQHAVVKELGYPKLTTVKDFENAIKAYKDKYPKIDGQATIGLSLLADDWRIWISTINPGMYSTQVTVQSGDGVIEDVNDKNYTLKEHFFRNDEKEYFRWLNHMNDIGLLDKESFVQKYDQYIAKLSSGRVLAITDAEWEVEDAQRALLGAGKGDRTWGRYPIVLREGLLNSEIGDTGFSPQSGVAITKSCKNPERAFKFLDWMTTDEAQILQFWGIENKDYVIENGKRVKTAERAKAEKEDADFPKKTGIGLYTHPFPYRGDSAVDATGQSLTAKSKEDWMAAYTANDKEVLAGYGVKMWIDLWPSADKFPTPPWGAGWTIQPTPDSEESVIQQKIDQLQFKYVPKIILVKPDKFDSTYDEFLSEMDKAGVKKIEKSMSKKYADRVKLWTEK